MDRLSCCFTGHRRISKEVSPILFDRLKSVVQELVSQDAITTFYTGGALGWDTLAARAVIEVRKELRDICLILVLPCKDQANAGKRSTGSSMTAY